MVRSELYVPTGMDMNIMNPARVATLPARAGLREPVWKAKRVAPSHVAFVLVDFTGGRRRKVSILPEIQNDAGDGVAYLSLRSHAPLEAACLAVWPEKSSAMGPSPSIRKAPRCSGLQGSRMLQTAFVRLLTSFDPRPCQVA